MSENPFWEFALQLYQQPGVESACLAFQDESGGNVCLLLFCCWLDVSECGVNVEQLKQLNKLVQDCESHFLAELRQLRKKSRPQPVEGENVRQLYQLTRRLELYGEEFLCNQLYRWYMQQPFRANNEPDLTRRYVSMLEGDAHLANLIIEAGKKLNGTIYQGR